MPLYKSCNQLLITTVTNDDDNLKKPSVNRKNLLAICWLTNKCQSILVQKDNGNEQASKP